MPPAAALLSRVTHRFAKDTARVATWQVARDRCCLSSCSFPLVGGSPLASPLRSWGTSIRCRPGTLLNPQQWAVGETNGTTFRPICHDIRQKIEKMQFRVRVIAKEDRSTSAPRRLRWPSCPMPARCLRMRIGCRRVTTRLRCCNNHRRWPPAGLQAATCWSEALGFDRTRRTMFERPMSGVPHVRVGSADAADTRGEAGRAQSASRAKCARPTDRYRPS